MPTRLEIAKSDIFSEFKKMAGRPFGKNEVQSVLRENRANWRLAQSTTVDEFIHFLQTKGSLKEHRIELPSRPTTRFSWGEATTFEVVQSLNNQGYFSHASAIFLHGLTEQVPKTIYFNIEQKASGTGGGLSQESINRAFKGKCRVSNNRTKFRDRTLCLLNGQNTNQLGVVDFSSVEGAGLRCTNIERTLIDATVRTIYSGGVAEVAEAFAAAQSHVSVNRLVAYLKTLRFTYPYHQAIGFYMDRAGNYSSSQLSLLRKFETAFDFYLTYQIAKPVYVPSWRIFVPEGFQ